jgi:cold shock protein
VIEFTRFAFRGVLVNMRIRGVVRWFNNSRGYGYIEANGQDVFVHSSASTGHGLKNLLEGDRVEWCDEDSHRGPPAADAIRLN